MKVAIVGGGPAGLYFSILFKKQHPDAQVTVFERNRADDTFGFGVVFSDQTLDNFAKHDAESYQDIVRNFAYWDDIAIHFKGSVHRIGGNGFCGCARRTLLLLLQQRASELGVELEVRDRDQRGDRLSGRRPGRHCRRQQQPLPRASRRSFRNRDRPAAEQVLLDGLGLPARRVHLRLSRDRMGPLHRPRLSVRARRLDLDLRDRSRNLRPRRPRPHERGGKRAADGADFRVAPEGTFAQDQSLDLAELPHDPQRALGARQQGAARRCQGDRALSRSAQGPSSRWKIPLRWPTHSRGRRRSQMHSRRSNRTAAKMSRRPSMPPTCRSPGSSIWGGSGTSNPFSLRSAS